MNPAELNYWRLRQGIRSWRAAAGALDIPYRRMLSYKSGRAEIPALVEGKCARLEHQVSVAGAARQEIDYDWAWSRLNKISALPEQDGRRGELASALLVAVCTTLALRHGAVKTLEIMRRTIGMVAGTPRASAMRPREPMRTFRQRYPLT